jgi:5-methylcytosine-specific restriction endonuclease McrA
VKPFVIRANLRSPVIFNGYMTLDALLMAELQRGDVSDLIHCVDDLYFASAAVLESEAGKIKASFVASMRPELTPEWLDVIAPNSNKNTDVAIGDSRYREAGNVINSYDARVTDAVARCPADGILIAAGAWSGLDSPALRWKTVVIPRAPYGPPTELDGQQVTHYIDSKVTATRRINQGLHRGLRTPEAICKLLLLDPRCNRPELLSAIPARFSVQSFSEGQRVELVLSKAERDPMLRKAALKVHGAICADCGDTALHHLDVHHLNPVSEGQRKTTIKDVVVVCKNCHADRHHAMRGNLGEVAELKKTAN